MTLNSVKRDLPRSPYAQRVSAGPRRSRLRTAKRLVVRSGRGRAGLSGRAIRLYWVIVGISEALMAMRLAGKLVTEAPANDFMRLVYQVTDILLAPFHGFWPTPPPMGRVLEVPTIVAIFLYFVFAWTAMDSVVALLARPPAARTTWLGRRSVAARFHRHELRRS